MKNFYMEVLKSDIDTEEVVFSCNGEEKHFYARPQGEWKHWGSPFSDEGVVNSCVCSLCGARFVEIPDEVFNFCPHCGASMVRGEEE